MEEILSGKVRGGMVERSREQSGALFEGGTILVKQFSPTMKKTYLVCTSETDTSAWNPKVARFYDYWLSLKPEQGLPGRQHFDPMDIPDLIARIWMLDVLREPLRYRYRLVGTKEVETLQREVTGQMFEDVHPQSYNREETTGRFAESVEKGVVTYRKGNVIAMHKKEHLTVENCVAPLARDGHLVDLLVGFSILYTTDGREN